MIYTRMSCMGRNMALIVALIIAIVDCAPVEISSPHLNFTNVAKAPAVNSSSADVISLPPPLLLNSSSSSADDDDSNRLGFYDQMVRLKYGEGFSFNHSCWTYNRTTCFHNAEKNNRSYNEEPTCHPVKQACRFSEPYCKSLQYIDPESLEDKWLNGLVGSVCAPHNSYLTAGYNEGYCKYTRNGNPNNTMSWAFCTGKYCNFWPQEVAHPEDPESLAAYRLFYKYEDEKSRPLPEEATPMRPTQIGTTTTRGNPNTGTFTVTWVAVGCIMGIIALVIIVIMSLCWKFRWYTICFSRYPSKDSDTGSSGKPLDIETLEVNDIMDLDLSTLVLHKQGRFGKVYLLDTPYHDYKAVVKVYNAKDKKFWDQERQVFSQPHMADHENIVRFLGPVCLGDDFAIILEFYSTNLTSYLKGHTLKWTEMVTIMQSMMKGYSHLHSCYTIPEDLSCKIPIVHRDVKSNNIMLDSNLNAKICDFNLSLVLERNLIEMEELSLPGTTRYMAPELLGSHMIRSREGLLQTDVYSIALILWEILTRYEKYKSASKTYRPPYDEYVGSNPAVKDMYEVVCVQKRRPYLAPQYHPVMEELVETIKDSWDDDGEMRLTSAGIESRINELFRQYPNQAPSLSEVTNTDSVELNNRNNLNG